MDALNKFILDQQLNQIRDVRLNGVVATRLKTPVQINGTLFDGSENVTIAGGQGGSDATSIAGYNIDITGLSTGDHIEFSGSTWNNINKETITDGGNF